MHPSAVPQYSYQTVRMAVPLRKKRADTELITPGNPTRSAFRGALTRSRSRLLDRVESNSDDIKQGQTPALPRPSLVSTVRNGSQNSSVHFGLVVGREYEVS